MVNEVFYSLQGEGVRAGTPNIFIRFSGCNLECSMKEGPKSPGGFDCDTEFASGRKVNSKELYEWMLKAHNVVVGDERPLPEWIILTGGEPGLQVDNALVDSLHTLGFKLAIETNGTVMLDGLGLDWITLSPKVAEHAVRQLKCDELKYVRGYDQGIPKPAAKANHYLISPAFDGGQVHPDTMKWCQKLVLENPKWRLSVQQHKQWGVR